MVNLPTPSHSCHMSSFGGGGVCDFTKNGRCKVHNVDGVSVPSKKWGDRGGRRGFGWITKRVQKFICKARNSGTKVSNISTKRDVPDDLAMDKIEYSGTIAGQASSLEFESESLKKVNQISRNNSGR